MEMRSPQVDSVSRHNNWWWVLSNLTWKMVVGKLPFFPFGRSNFQVLLMIVSGRVSYLSPNMGGWSMISTSHPCNSWCDHVLFKLFLKGRMGWSYIIARFMFHFFLWQNATKKITSKGGVLGSIMVFRSCFCDSFLWGTWGTSQTLNHGQQMCDVLQKNHLEVIIQHLVTVPWPVGIGDGWHEYQTIHKTLMFHVDSIL